MQDKINRSSIPHAVFYERPIEPIKKKLDEND